MATNINPQPSLDEIRELLSPYLDGEVSAEERLWVEQAVATSAELRQELESLRQTVSLLAALPSVAAPRPFTLSAADVQAVSPGMPKRSFWWSTWLGTLAMSAAALLCVVIAGWVLFSASFGAAPQQVAYSPQEEAAAPQAPPAPAQAEADTAERETQAEAGLTVEREKEEAAAEEPAQEELAAEADQESAAGEVAKESATAAKAVETNEPSVTLAAPAEEIAAAEAAED